MFDNKRLSIKFYEHININVHISIDLRTITLLKMYYVSQFMINIMFKNILKNKSDHFDI